MSDTNTSVGRDASAGGDFIGRDKYNVGDGGSSVGSSRVEIHAGPHRGDFTSAEILQNLQKAILGNPYNLAEPGMLRSIANLSESMAAFHAWRATADVERANLNREINNSNQRLATMDSRITAIMAIVWITVAIVGVEAVALIWLFIQRSMAG